VESAHARGWDDPQHPPAGCPDEREHGDPRTGGYGPAPARARLGGPRGDACPLVFLPYLTLPFYWTFGRRRFEGYISARRSGIDAIHGVSAELRGHRSEFEAQLEESGFDAREIERLAAMPFTEGNAVRLLVDGPATFEDLFEGIEAAREYVLVQFFIVHDDGLGRELKELLLRKAREGVRVHFLYDQVGSHALPQAYLDDLRAAGVEARPFQSTRGRSSRFQINFRNHRKIVVADGRRAWLGGHNVGDEYVGRDPGFGRWRDTHLALEGPSVQCVQLAFLEDWYWATHSIPELQWLPRKAEGSDRHVLILPTGPADDFESCGLFFCHAIHHARRRLWIASPYFVPDSSVVSALLLAGLRGADVRILLPDKPDHLLVYLAAFSYLPTCERAGVRFYRYTGGFLHQKVMLVDDMVASVGTANLDSRSFKLNFEITAVMHDRDFAAQVEHMLERDFAESRPVGAADFEQRSFPFRLAVRIARLFAPLL
jgi:cardiolipin synthase